MSSLSKSYVRSLAVEAVRLLGPVAELDGRALYSSIETLRPGKFYFMGLNPGAGSDQYNHVGKSLIDMGNHNRNTYIDDDWGRGQGKGGHPLQKRVRFIFGKLGVQTQDVFSTNLVFARSQGWGAEQRRLVPSCLRVHELFFRVVQPKVVLVYGSETFSSLVKHSPHSAQMFDTGVPNGSENYFCRVADTELFGRDTRLVGLPHLSKFKIDAQSRTVDWLVNQVAL